VEGVVGMRTHWSPHGDDRPVGCGDERESGHEVAKGEVGLNSRHYKVEVDVVWLVGSHVDLEVGIWRDPITESKVQVLHAARPSDEENAPILEEHRFFP
jgi:hypothetical protein